MARPDWVNTLSLTLNWYERGSGEKWEKALSLGRGLFVHLNGEKAVRSLQGGPALRAYKRLQIRDFRFKIKNLVNRQ
jgi:hypothetical protein